jgi:anti-sigma regulatory factor (Ser/Thr protein kinase)
MSDSIDDSTVKIILANQVGYERIAMACSASFAEMFSFPKERIEDLKTIVAEASMNAMQHGNKGRVNAKVTVSLSCQDDTIRVWVADEGSGIKVKPPKPDIEKIMNEDQTTCGFGLFLIEQLADQVIFKESAGRGHVVEMVLKMKA